MIKELVENLESFKLVKKNGKEYQYNTCPFCGAKENSFQVNFAKEVFLCNKQNSCGASGTLYSLAKFLGIETKTVSRIEINKNVLTREFPKEVEDFVNGRGISLETLSKFRTVWNKESNTLDFISVNSKGEIISIKKRNVIPDKIPKEYTVETSKNNTLFNIEYAWSDRIFITEGMIDMLTLCEIGIPKEQLTSLIGGCMNINFVDELINVLEKKNEIIMLFDNDKAGKEALNKIYLKPELLTKVKIINYKKMKDCTDINEFYTNYGRDELLDVLSELEIPHAESVKSFANLSDEDVKMLPDFDNIHIDYLLNGHREGEITAHISRGGGSKSTFIANYISHFISNEIKVFLFNGELSENQLSEWLFGTLGKEEDFNVVGKDYRGNTKYSMKQEAKNKIRNAVKPYLSVISNSHFSAKKLISAMKLDFFARGTKIFFIDNLMCLDLFEYSNENELKAEELFIKELKNFAKEFGVHVHLIAHTNKNGQMLEIESLDKTNISGSSKIPNLIDNCIAYDLKLVQIAQNSEVLLNCMRLLKNRHEGENRNTRMYLYFYYYSPASKRLNPVTSKYNIVREKDTKTNKYSFDNLEFKKIKFDIEKLIEKNERFKNSETKIDLDFLEI